MNQRHKVNVLMENFEGLPFYANDATETTFLASAFWNVYGFSVQSGIKASTEDDLAIRDKFSQGNFVGVYNEEEMDVTILRNDVPLYSFEVPWIAVNEGRRVTVAFDQVFSSYVIVSDLDAPVEQMPKFFTPGDLNPAKDEPCDYITSGSRFGIDSDIQCNRSLNHVGDHQIIKDKRHVTILSSGGGRASYGKMFGIPLPCDHCACILETTGDKNKVYTCSTCEYWLQQSVVQREKAFVINGVHYRAGEGGFDGKQFHIKRCDGTEYHGGLWYQGEIPVQFRYLFPDDAEWIGDGN